MWKDGKRAKKRQKTEGQLGGVTDLINRIVQVLREDLYWFRISAQEAGLLEPAELGDEG